MENLNFDKEIIALSRHRSVQRFHFRGGSRSCQIARKILCQRIRKVTAQREFATVNIKVPSFVHNPAAETSDCYSQSGNCKRQLASIRVCLSVAFACAYFALGSSVQITIRMFCAAVFSGPLASVCACFLSISRNEWRTLDWLSLRQAMWKSKVGMLGRNGRNSTSTGRRKSDQIAEVSIQCYQNSVGFDGEPSYLPICFPGQARSSRI
jgi:hypothetical protein